MSHVAFCSPRDLLYSRLDVALAGRALYSCFSDAFASRQPRPRELFHLIPTRPPPPTVSAYVFYRNCRLTPAQLITMGFKEEHVHRGTSCVGFDLNALLSWLCEHPDGGGSTPAEQASAFAGSVRSQGSISHNCIERTAKVSCVQVAVPSGARAGNPTAVWCCPVPRCVRVYAPREKGCGPRYQFSLSFWFTPKVHQTVFPLPRVW